MATATEPKPKTELVSKPATFTVAPITFEVQMEAIEQLGKEYLPLAVLDVNDKEQVAAVHDARMKCVKLRTSIDKRRKSLKEDATRYSREVDTAARTLIDALSPIEEHLSNEEGKVKREQERIAREAEEKRQATVRERLGKLQACGKSYMEADVADLPDDEFEALHQSELKEKAARDEKAAADEAERQRIAAEQKAKAAELAKLEADLKAKQDAADARTKRMQARLELLSRQGYSGEYTGDQLADMEPAAWESLIQFARDEKAKRDKIAADEAARVEQQRKDNEAAQAKIDAENKRIADEKAERERQAELEKAKAAAAEQARLQAIEDQKRAEAEAKAKAEAEEAERKRQEELRPDREKIALFADSVMQLAAPQLSAKSQHIQVEINAALATCSTAIRAAGSKLK